MKAIKKLLALVALKLGASPEIIDESSGMGSGNIRAMFPEKKRKKPGSTENTSTSPSQTEDNK